MPPFLFMDFCPRVYSDLCFSTLLPWQGNFSIFSDTSLATLLLDALPLHRLFWHLHCFAVSYPCWACFLLDISSKCLLHHAPKCSPYPVQSMCIHWLNIVHPIIFPVHEITSNLGFWIFQNVMHAHVPLTMYVSLTFWQIFHCLISCDQYLCEIRCGIFLQEICHKFDKHWMAVF